MDILSLEILEAVEKSAIAAAYLRGKGDERAADKAAVDAMRATLGALPLDGIVVIGEGERDEAPMLYIGERIGKGEVATVDIAVDPLEGTAICAKYGAGALSVMALARRGGFLHAPDTYMKKIAAGPGSAGVIDVDKSPKDNAIALSEVLGKPVSELTIAVLDRPRHEDIIRELRELGTRVRLFTDGDVSVAIETCLPLSPVDLLIGVGGSPEGVLAAAAMKSLGGYIEGRLVLRTEEERQRAAGMGVEPVDKKLTIDDMVKGDAVFYATGVTDGLLLRGVDLAGCQVTTHSLITSSEHRKMQYVTRTHLV